MSEVYAFIEAEKTTHHVALLCRPLKVARSSFSAWPAGEKARTARKAADEALAHEITVLHVASKATYGVPRIHAGLRRLGHRVNRKRIERVMREHGISGVTRRKRRSLTRPATSPISPPMRAGCIWRPGWTSPPARSSATRWPTTTAPTWSWTR